MLHKILMSYIVSCSHEFWVGYTFSLVSTACGLPLYESDGRCVETCPDGQFGNGSTTTLTGTCDPCK